MAIELSNTSWLIGMMTPLSDKISLRKIDSGAVQHLIETIGRTIDKVSRATGRVPQIVSCYEAGYDGFWLHRVLEARGVVNHVFNAASLMVGRKA
jgi:transposase